MIAFWKGQLGQKCIHSGLACQLGNVFVQAFILKLKSSWENLLKITELFIYWVLLYKIFTLTSTALSQSSVKVRTRPQASLRPHSWSSSCTSLPSTSVCRPVLVSIKLDNSTLRRSDSFSRPWCSNTHTQIQCNILYIKKVHVMTSKFQWFIALSASSW